MFAKGVMSIEIFPNGNMQTKCLISTNYLKASDFSLQFNSLFLFFFFFFNNNVSHNLLLALVSIILPPKEST